MNNYSSKFILFFGLFLALLMACSKDNDPVVEDEPKITVLKAEVNIYGGATLNILNNRLKIDDEIVMKWNDNNNFTVVVSLGSKTIKDGETLSDEGKLKATVTNKSGKSAAAEIKLVNKAITNINLALQVDHETDLLDGITFANEATVIKTIFDFEGTKTIINDPHHFTPEYPGICTFVFTIKSRDGKTSEEKVENVTITPLGYTEPELTVADMIETLYPWYNKLSQSSRDFIYPHLLASYAACNQFKLDSRVHIIMGETWKGAENIGQFTTPSDHAYEGYFRIKYLSPYSSIKGCKDHWSNLEVYINNHPNNCFFVSCASDQLVCANYSQMTNHPNVPPLRRILDKNNVISIFAIGNQTTSHWEIYNESIINANNYNGSSFNSKKKNKISVSGYHSNGYNNFFSPNYQFHSALQSYMPVGYDKNKGNIVMPMCALIDSNGKEDNSTSSSYPTAVTSAVVGNAVSIVMANRPGITPVGAMDIIVAKYLREETFQYLDEATMQKVDGGFWYFLKIEELINNELLQADKLEVLNFQNDEVQLPRGKGLCYTGKGIQFEVNGERHDLTDTQALTQALNTGNAKWYWNRRLSRKQGATSTTEINAYITDLNGEIFPNFHYTVTKPM